MLVDAPPGPAAFLATRLAAAGWRVERTSLADAAAVGDGVLAAVLFTAGERPGLLLACCRRLVTAGRPCVLVLDRTDGRPIRLPRAVLELVQTVISLDGRTQGRRRDVVRQVLQSLQAALPGGMGRRPPVAGAAVAAAPAAVTGVIAVGASTGGTEALRSLLTVLPPTLPPLLMVQHMPAGFTAPLARRLDMLSAFRVREATPDLPLRSGMAVLAPAGRHMELAGRPGEWRVRLVDTEPVNGHRPSVDVLFHSVAAAGAAAVGVLLTGMGNDGAAGLLALRRAGAFTVAQDEATSVIYGMPREAARLDAAQRILPLDAIPAAVMEAVLRRGVFVPPLGKTG